MNWLLNNSQFLILFLIFGSSVFGWIVKALQKQAESKRIESERERRRLEALRTGQIEKPQALPRQAPAADSYKPASLEEIAARRQAQLEELRRRRAQLGAPQAGAPTAPSRRPPTTPIPDPRRTTALPQQRAPRQAQPQARPQPAGPQQQRPQPRPVQPPTRRPQQPTPVAAPAPKRRRPPPERISEHVEVHGFDALAEKPRPKPPRPAPTPGAIRPERLTPADMRRAVVLSEILAPPVSMRRPDPHA